MSTLLSALALLTRSLYHIIYPVLNHQIRHHIEDGGRQMAPLCHPPETLECLPVVSPSSCDHPQPIPVCPKDAVSLRPNAVSLQDIQSSVPVQGVNWRVFNIVLVDIIIIFLLFSGYLYQLVLIFILLIYADVTSS